MWKQPQPPTLPDANPTTQSAPAETLDEQRTACIGKSIVIKGDVIGGEDLMVEGHVEGRLELHGHALLLGPDARVQAHVAARVITILGAVTGNVTASERVDLRGSGSVDGNINAPRIAMADGAQVRGHIDSLSSAAADPHQSPAVAVQMPAVAVQM